MRLDPWLRVLFILYCLEAGVFLTVTPWGFGWDRSWLSVPLPALRGFFLHPAARGAVTGFGVVHLVWGAHDLAAWIAGLRRKAPGELR